MIAMRVCFLVPELSSDDCDRCMFVCFVAELRVNCLLLQKPVLKRQVLAGAERLLCSGGQQPGEKVDLCLKAKPLDSAKS